MSEARKKKEFWPLICTGLVLLLCLIPLWLIWQDQARGSARAKAQESRIQELLREKEGLEGLLGLSPCEAQARIGRKPEEAQKPVSQTPVPKEVADIADIEKACVFLVSTDGKTGLSTGSGFFVAPGYVLTNRHVIEKGNGKALVTSASLGQPAMAKVVAASQGGKQDFALLNVEMPATARTAILPFSTAARKTEKVGAWGFPHIVGEHDPAYRRLLNGDLSAAPELSYTEGVVSAVLAGQPQIIVHTAPISPGNSGGPLLNANGEVIGINSMIQLDDASYRQASLAIGADDLLRFLAEHGIKAVQK